MAVFTSTSPAARIDKIKGEILGHAMINEVLGITGMQRQLPKNQGKTVVYRRYLPHGATATNFNTQNRIVLTAASHELAEGTTPAADTMTPQDVPVSLKQYGCLYQLTDVVSDTYEDPVVSEMSKNCGERVAGVREAIRYGVVKACTNVFYGGGGSTRVSVNSKITLPLLRRITKNLKANHTKMITGILEPSDKVTTKYVEASYLVFVHSDADGDIRDLPGFVPVAAYGTRKTVSPYELGTAENFRFITSPELAPYLAGGVAVGATGLASVGGANVDVYPFIVCGEDAWGQVALRGGDAIDPTYIPVGQKDKNDPLGQRGYIGSKFYMNCVLLNEGWMAVAECGVTA